MRKSSEEAVRQVLAGLRDAEAPIGMERRILTNYRRKMIEYDGETIDIKPSLDRHYEHQRHRRSLVRTKTTSFMLPKMEMLTIIVDVQ